MFGKSRSLCLNRAFTQPVMMNNAPNIQSRVDTTKSLVAKPAKPGAESNTNCYNWLTTTTKLH
jgi:hypothetical protein